MNLPRRSRVIRLSAKTFRHDIGEDNDYAERAEKAENLSDVGENEVVVYFRHIDVLIDVLKETLAENSPGFQCSKTEILLILDILRISAGVEEYSIRFLWNSLSKLNHIPAATPATTKGAATRYFHEIFAEYEHKQKYSYEYDSRTVVALQCDDTDRYSGVKQQKQHMQRLVHIFLVAGEVVAEREYEGYLHYL